jgi:hypothetical protein
MPDQKENNMKTLVSTITGLALAAFVAQADSNTFQSIIGDAARIQTDSKAISAQLKGKAPDFELVKTKSAELSKDIKDLQRDLESFEATHPNLTAEQKKNWELVKTKAQLLLIFSDTKSSLLASGDPQKNKSMLRAYSDGIAERALMLQETAKKLDR